MVEQLFCLFESGSLAFERSEAFYNRCAIYLVGSIALGDLLLALGQFDHPLIEQLAGSDDLGIEGIQLTLRHGLFASTFAECFLAIVEVRGESVEVSGPNTYLAVLVFKSS